jgi:hypothetical protein
MGLGMQGTLLARSSMYRYIKQLLHILWVLEMTNGQKTEAGRRFNRAVAYFTSKKTYILMITTVAML